MANTTRSRFRTLAYLVLTMSFTGCGNDDSDDSNDESCTPGELGCQCNVGLCLNGLDCLNNFCVSDGNSGDGDGDLGDGDGDPGDGDGDSGDGDGDGDSGDGDGDSGDGDGDPCTPNELFCGGQCIDPTADAENCGSCGKVCTVTNGKGGCDSGICSPALTECIAAEDPPQSCNDVCAAEGKACVAQGCDTATYNWYGSIALCDQFVGTPSGSSCDHPMVASTDFYRCCCQG